MARFAMRAFGSVSSFSHRLRSMVLAASIVVGIVATTGIAGYADPSPAPGTVEAQIDATWGQLEPLIEKYNAVHEQDLAMQAKVSALQAQIQPLQMQVDLAMTRVGVMSAEAYKFGPGSKLNALLSSGSPDDFLGQLGSLDEIARHETAMVAGVAALRDQYNRQKAPLDAALSQLQQQDAALAAQKQQIQDRITQLNQLRLTAYGSGGGTGALRPVACPQTYDGSLGARAAKFACAQIGKPYIWAAAGPKGFDCSGLTEGSWASVGIGLPHNALEQKHVTTPVSLGNLHVGDLVYYYPDVHHVVIYVGNQWVVSAPTYGEPVQMQKLDMSRYNSAGRPHGG